MLPVFKIQKDTKFQECWKIEVGDEQLNEKRGEGMRDCLWEGVEEEIRE